MAAAAASGVGATTTPADQLQHLVGMKIVGTGEAEPPGVENKDWIRIESLPRCRSDDVLLLRA
jgi:hypothetical protein